MPTIKDNVDYYYDYNTQLIKSLTEKEDMLESTEKLDNGNVTKMVTKTGIVYIVGNSMIMIY